MENVDPNTFGSPSDEAIVERLARTVGLRRVNPTTAGLQDMHDAADDPAIINPRLATRIGRQQRLEARELIFRQPEMITIHRWSPFGDRESQTDRRWNPLYGSGP